MLTFLASNPVGWFMAVAGVIGGSVLVMDYLSKSLDLQKEKLQKVRTAYDDVSKELQSLQEEQLTADIGLFPENKKRINKLSDSLGSLGAIGAIGAVGGISSFVNNFA